MQFFRFRNKSKCNKLEYENVERMQEKKIAKSFLLYSYVRQLFFKKNID